MQIDVLLFSCPVARVKNLMVECRGAQQGMLNLLFDLPLTFPHLRQLCRESRVHLIIRSFTESRSPSIWNWRPIPIGPDQFLSREDVLTAGQGTMTHGLVLSRELFPPQGTHWLQAMLSIEEKTGRWSPFCNRERNILRLTTGTCEFSYTY